LALSARKGEDLRDLQSQIMDAVSLHFNGAGTPRQVRLHFVSDPILVHA
jgi:hypothetical protein